MYVHDYNFSQDKIMYCIVIWKQRKANTGTDSFSSAFASPQYSSQRARSSKVSHELVSKTLGANILWLGSDKVRKSNMKMEKNISGKQIS